MVSFSNDLDFFDRKQSTEHSKVVISIQQRTAKKYITMVTELAPELMDEVVKQIKKTFHCNGSKVTDKTTQTTYLQFSGDQRANIKTYLIDAKGLDESEVVVRGF